MGTLKRIIKKLINFGLDSLSIAKFFILPKKENTKPVAFLLKVSRWKYPFIPDFLKEYDVRFVPFRAKLKVMKYEIERYNNKVFIAWSFNEDQEYADYAKERGIPLYRIEDGFIRSVGLGAMHTPPYSLCIDKKGLYFDSSQPSDLEGILNTYDFKNDPDFAKAKDYIDLILKLGISKYNHVAKKNIEDVYGPKKAKRILVIGQVEDDASIKRGSNRKWTNNDLVRLAREENPDCEVIYKPHPDVLSGRRARQSNPKDVEHLAKIIEEPLSLADSFETIDHVYTITSLSGFEAMLRGIPVTTAGAPFYSGWGLTDDRQPVDRRKRKLTLEELFFGAYVVYPRYVDPNTKEQLNLEETIKRISSNL